MFPPTGQCTGIRVKEVGDDAPRRDAWLCGNRRSEGNRPLRKATRPRVAVHKSLLVVATPASSRTLIFLLIATSPFLPSPPLSVCLSFCVCGVPSARPSSIFLSLSPSLSTSPQSSTPNGSIVHACPRIHQPPSRLQSISLSSLLLDAILFLVVASCGCFRCSVHSLVSSATATVLFGR